MDRIKTLSEAAFAVNGDRDETYGAPEDNLGRIAAYWTVLFATEITPGKVALALALVKIARTQHTPTHADNWIDLAGYAAIGAEVSDATTEA